jgi:hypothetical protein
MSTSSRLTLSFTALALAVCAMGCSKEKEDPVVMALPSAAAVAPAKAVEDTPAQPTQPATAAATDTAAAAATPAAPATDAPKAAPPQPIDGCCSALAAMTKDAKVDAVTKSKATAAMTMCNATAPLVKSGKTVRSTALTQIKATMAGSAPAACN